jgi:hypothetical protein
VFGADEPMVQYFRNGGKDNLDTIAPGHHGKMDFGGTTSRNSKFISRTEMLITIQEKMGYRIARRLIVRQKIDVSKLVLHIFGGLKKNTTFWNPVTGAQTWVHYFTPQQDRQCTYNVTARSRNHCSREKSIHNTCSACLCSDSLKHAKHMRPVILSCVACPALRNFSALPQKRLFTGKLLNIKCVYFLYSLCLKHFSFKELSEILCYHKYTYVFLYSTRYSCQILMKLELYRQKKY